jgi:formamidopyrimidine-DNA glycosylase
MPEGHTLHRLAGELNDAFAGRPVRVGSPQGRFADSAALLDGSVLVGADAWGKKLYVEFAGDRFVYVHLGLIGGFLVHRDVAEVPPPVGEVRLRIMTTTAFADLRGATACELVTREQRDAAVARLGPDPLRADADPERAPRRAAVPAPDAPAAPGPHAPQRPVAGDVGRPGRADERGRADRADRHGPPRAHAGGDGPGRAGRRPWR